MLQQKLEKLESKSKKNLSQLEAMRKKQAALKKKSENAKTDAKAQHRRSVTDEIVASIKGIKFKADHGRGCTTEDVDFATKIDKVTQ